MRDYCSGVLKCRRGLAVVFRKAAHALGSSRLRVKGAREARVPRLPRDDLVAKKYRIDDGIVGNPLLGQVYDLHLVILGLDVDDSIRQFAWSVAQYVEYFHLFANSIHGAADLKDDHPIDFLRHHRIVKLAAHDDCLRVFAQGHSVFPGAMVADSY